MENPPSPSVPPPSATPPQQGAINPEIAGLVASMQSGASWFFWIAALSLINSIAAFSQSNFQFVVGLGITQIIDGIVAEAGTAGKTIAFVIDLIAAGIFALFGVFARKGNAACFVIGMILYALDALILLPFGVWINIGFHVFALYCIFSGFLAQRQLSKIADLIPRQA